MTAGIESPEAHSFVRHDALDVLLTDGTTAQLRAIEPTDADRLVRFHEGLSPDSVWFRYFGVHPHLTPNEVERLTVVDGRDRLALVALVGDELVGVASYDRLANRSDAEVAVVVADAFQGKGVATVLLEHLADRARRNSIERFVADVLPTNAKMLHVFRDAGFGGSSEFDDGVVHVSFPLVPSPRTTEAIAAREHHAEVSSLRRVLQPRSVAIVGAGRHPGKVGHEVARALISGGFSGEIHLVSRSGANVLGRQALTDLREVPRPVDLVVVAVPAPDVYEVVETAGEVGAAGVVVLSAGFAEDGAEGVARQRALVEVARAHGVRVIGPNCLGIINTDPAVRLDVTFGGIHPPPGPIGFYTQSGAVGIEALAEANARALGLATFVSVGNKADVSGNDLLQWWEQDQRTSVIGMYLESFGNPVKFRRIAHRVGRAKPIVALKAGRTEAGARAAASHTAAIASPDRLVDALFRDSGVIRVPSFETLFDTLGILGTQPLPAGPRVAVVTNSGGAGILAADALGDASLTIADIDGPNPIDLRADAGPDAYAKTVGRLMDDAHVDAVIAIFVPTSLTDAEDVAAVLEQVASAKTDGHNADGARSRKPLVGVFLAGANPDPARAPHVARIGTVERAAQALARALAYRRWRDSARPPVPPPPNCRLDAARETARRLLTTRGPGWLEVDEYTDLLSTVGIELAHGEVVTSAAGARDAASRLGTPAAVKAVSSAIVHKSDVGAVVLDVPTPFEAARAYEHLLDRLGTQLDGALVQSMAGPGEEVILGAVRDPAFGALVLFGAGGTRAEILADQAFRLTPVTEDAANDMIASTRISHVLDGWRGSPPLDVAGLTELLMRVSYLADAVPEIAELDLNPVIVGRYRNWVVDARIRIDKPPAELDATRHLR